MADTRETAIIFAIIITSFSLFMGATNDYLIDNDQPAFFKQSNEALLQTQVSREQFEDAVNSFKKIADIISGSKITEAPILLDAGATILGFTINVLANAFFGWAAVTETMLISVGLGVFATFIAGAMIVVQLIGLFEIATRFKRLLPFVG